MFTRNWPLWFLVVLLCLPGAAVGQDVLAGFDLFWHSTPTEWDFSSMPLPANFFGPGSDPFDGQVYLNGSDLDPIPPCPDKPDSVSVYFQRKQPASLPGVPSSDVVDLEIMDLALVSIAPITVSYMGGSWTEEWEVEIGLSPTLQSTGTITIRKEHADGGTFDIAVILRPYFTFTRVSDSYVQELDGAGTWDDLIETMDVPWVYSPVGHACPPCAGNFLPGCNGTMIVPFVLSGPLSVHTVISACTLNIPTLSQWGMIAVAALLLVAGVYMISRKRKAATARS